MGLYYGIRLRDYMTGSYYRIILRNDIMELYYGIISMKTIPGMPGTSPEPPGIPGIPHGPKKQPYLNRYTAAEALDYCVQTCL